ncbi:MAG: hypothetical protein J6W26_05290 [Bacteroidales bacterium]|nr:hypothetical protein [Bacteroidales bacterium]
MDKLAAVSVVTEVGMEDNDRIFVQLELLREYSKTCDIAATPFVLYAILVIVLSVILISPICIIGEFVVFLAILPKTFAEPLIGVPVVIASA